MLVERRHARLLVPIAQRFWPKTTPQRATGAAPVPRHVGRQCPHGRSARQPTPPYNRETQATSHDQTSAFIVSIRCRAGLQSDRKRQRALIALGDCVCQSVSCSASSISAQFHLSFVLLAAFDAAAHDPTPRVHQYRAGAAAGPCRRRAARAAPPRSPRAGGCSERTGAGTLPPDRRALRLPADRHRRGERSTHPLHRARLAASRPRRLGRALERFSASVGLQLRGSSRIG